MSERGTRTAPTAGGGGGAPTAGREGAPVAIGGAPVVTGRAAVTMAAGSAAIAAGAQAQVEKGAGAAVGGVTAGGGATDIVTIDTAEAAPGVAIKVET